MKSEEIIRGVGLKATMPRVLVYDIIRERGHGTVDEVVALGVERDLQMTVSTVYRIMDSFCEAGLLSKITHPDGRMVYDITVGEHGHIFSEEGEIEDLMDERLMALVTRYLQDRLGEEREIERVSIKVLTKKR